MDSSEVTSLLAGSHEVIPLNLDLSPYDELMTLIKNLQADVNFLKEENERKRKMETDNVPIPKKKSRISTQDLHEKLIAVEMDLKKYLKIIIELINPQYIIEDSN